MKKALYLIIPSAFLLIFILFTILVKVVDVHYIQDIGFLGFYTINTKFMTLLQGFNTHLFDVLSDVLLYALFASVIPFGVIGLVQMIKRKSLFKIDKVLFVIYGGYVLMVFLYMVFEVVKINFSPTSTPKDLKSSYPSSHVFIFMTLLGLALLGLKRYKNTKPIRTIVYAEFILLSILMAGIRLFSGQHYVTDIVAGILLALVLLSAAISVDSYIHRPLETVDAERD